MPDDAQLIHHAKHLAGQLNIDNEIRVLCALLIADAIGQVGSQITQAITEKE